MKRFKIINTTNDLEFYVEAISLSMSPEYGDAPLITEEDTTNECLMKEVYANRLAEYPSLGDFADAFVKLHTGDPSAMSDYVEKCLAVKAKFPKP